MTLIDVIVGVSIMLVVFLGIFGAFRISIELVFSTKAKTGAISILTEKLEYIRSLPYDAVGTVGGIPSGDLPQVEQVTLNGLTYTVRTLVQYTDAPEDGLDASDDNGITADYKTVKVELVWNVKESSRNTFAVTRIAPLGQESLEGGGTLRIHVFDNNVDPVEGATVRIVNASTVPAIDVSADTNTQGSVSFPGTPEASGYEIYVSKPGYSSAQTYGVTAGNPNPSPIHVSVVESHTTTASFSIDHDAALSIATYEPEGPGSFEDAFANGALISSSSSAAISGGVLTLYEDPGAGYVPSGEAYAVSTGPDYLTVWDEAQFALDTPADTALVVRLYYYDGSAYALVPDDDLPGNSVGFAVSPVDLSLLDVAQYHTLRLAAFMTSSDPAVAPAVSSWSLAYRAGPSPLPNVPFTIHGAKTMGTDSGGQPLYKYDDSFTTTQYAEWHIDPIEWDAYTLAHTDSAYDLVERCPHTVAPAPGETLAVAVTLGDDTPHSLRVTVTGDAGDALAGASVNISGADAAIGTTSACGQTYFGDIGSGTYTVTVSAGGFQTAIETAEVDGETSIVVGLTP